MPEPLTPRTLVLVGMMGSGKTTIGRRLAGRTGWRYMDNDELVRAVTGRQPQEIDAQDGEAALHTHESEALRYALTLPPPLIVGAAAGVVTDPDALAQLQATPFVVYLHAPAEILHSRIGSGDARRDEATDLAWLRTRQQQRDSTYREIAALRFDTNELEPGEISDRIIEYLRGQRHRARG